MAAAIDASLQQVQADMEQAATVFKPKGEQLQKWEKDRQTVKDGATKFKEVAHQFDAYAEAMVKVAQAGQQRDESINRAFKATESLIEASKEYLSPLGAPFTTPLATAAAQIGAIVKRLNDHHTNQKLKSLASPEQEERIQAVARALRAGLAEYARIDAATFDLLLDNDAKHDLINRYSGSVQRRQEYVIARLEALAEAETALLTQPNPDGSLGDSGGILAALDALRADPTGTIRQAFNKFKYGTPRHSTTAHAALLAALKKRESYYLNYLDESSLSNQVPQRLHEAEQTRWQALVLVPQQQSQALFAKSQQLVGTWASGHHDLRQALLKADAVTRQDLLAQAQNVQKLITQLQDAREASAKAAREAATIAAQQAPDKQVPAVATRK